MDELERQEQLLREAMRELQESSTVSADTFDKLTKETSKLGKTIENAEEALDRFWRGPVGKTTKALGDVASGLARGAQAARSNRESFESLNPVIEGAAQALSAIPLVGDALGKTLQTVGTFVTAELQKSVESFQTLGSVGGVGAAGVTGLRKSAEAAGLAFDQLAKITANNAKGLAFATGSTAEGARAIAQLTQAAQPFRGQLLALGVGINEQSEFFADYLQINRRLGRAQTRDYRTLASGAADYAKQLNLLARLTGESADAMKAELESQQSNVMFRAAMRGLEPDIQEGAQNIAAILGKAGPTFQQGIQDLFGGSIGTDAAQAVFRATGGQARDIIDAFKNRLITQEEALARFRDAAERQRATVGNDFFATAGNLNHAFSQVGIEMFNLADNAALTRQNLARVGIEAVKAAQAQDPATGEMVNAQKALQRFAQEADKFVNDLVFPNATKVIAKLTSGLDHLAGKVNELAGVEGRAKGGPITGGQPYVVGEVGPEIVVPGASGTVLTAKQSQSIFDMLMGAKTAGTGDYSRGFLPGIGFVDRTGIGAGEVNRLTGFGGETLAEAVKYAAGNLTSMQVTAGDQTYRSGNYQYGDLSLQQGMFASSGPSSYYDSIMSGVTPVEGTKVVDKSDLYNQKTLETSNEKLLAIQEQMVSMLSTIATNTKSGNDTTKKILRATTG